MTFFLESEHFSGRIGALRWSILVGKQKHNVQNKGGKFLKKLWCTVGGEYNKIIWFYQLLIKGNKSIMYKSLPVIRLPALSCRLCIFPRFLAGYSFTRTFCWLPVFPRFLIVKGRDTRCDKSLRHVAATGCLNKSPRVTCENHCRCDLSHKFKLI